MNPYVFDILTLQNINNITIDSSSKYNIEFLDLSDNYSIDYYNRDYTVYNTDIIVRVCYF